MEIGTKIRQIRKEKGLTIEQLATAIGSDVGNLSRLERNKQGYTDDLLNRVATALGVEIWRLFIDTDEPPPEARPDEWGKLVDEELKSQSLNLAGNGTPLRRATDSDNDNAESVLTRGRLPLISWVQAGQWGETIDNFHPHDAEEWIPCPFNHSDEAFILRVVGLSMYNPGGDKSYAPGEYIAVDPHGEAMNKKMVVARIDDEDKATFKQLLIDPEGTMILQALNPEYRPRAQEMPKGSRIVGTVIGKWVAE